MVKGLDFDHNPYKLIFFAMRNGLAREIRGPSGTLPTAGESQLPCLLTPHSLDENIKPIIFPLPVNDESTIGRPTGLFTTSCTFGQDIVLLRF